MDNYGDQRLNVMPASIGSRYLHGAAQSVDAIVGVLGLQALEGGLHDVVLLGEQVVGSVKQLALARCP
jgi:hypothetical protein